MVVISLKETEILLLSNVLSDYTTDTRGYEILKIFDKFYKTMKSRLLKTEIKKRIDDFKTTNKITDLKVYKKK